MDLLYKISGDVFMINLIIFSKDRACQLDSLLRSIKDNLEIEHNISVLFDYSNDEYKKGYDILRERFDSILFVKETNFYYDTLRLSLNKGYACILWLVDDCIMKNILSKDSIFERFLNDDAVGIYNLRMTPTMLRMTDFIDDVPRQLPDFGPDNTWEWRKAVDTDWNYPMTMDGHMYKTKDMLSYLPKLKFGPPPDFDCTMWQNPLDCKLMVCNSQQKILGIVPNRVQTGSPNRHGNITTKELNDLWLDGKQIDLDHLYKLDEGYGKYHYMTIMFEDR